MKEWSRKWRGFLWQIIKALKKGAKNGKVQH